MEKEKRMIDANALKNEIAEENPYIHIGPFGYCACSPKTDGELVFKREDVLRAIDSAPTVDAVEVVEYIKLREQYDKIFTEFHELRDAFVDYVCSGIPNPAPFCKNKCPGCCDSRGWCKNDDKCKGFNPAKIFMDRERKDL